MGRLAVLVTSPRLPAGLLTGQAWKCLHTATMIAAHDVRSPLALAVAAEGLAVEEMPDASAARLLALAEQHDLVWLAADDGDPRLIRTVATEVVRRADSGRTGDDVQIEVVVGSYDPMGARLLDLVEVMDRLRVDCPWDRDQTHESLVRYLVEETYEAVEAIESGDRDHMREELGDLLLQVLFHARMAQEHDSAPFGIDDVASAIVDKLVRRHPHVFAAEAVAAGSEGPHDLTRPSGVQSAWEDIKSAEKSRASVMDGLPPGLPALSLAAKVVDRMGGRDAVAGSHPVEAAGLTAESLGEVLFGLVAAAGRDGLDAEQALRRRVRQVMTDVRAGEQRALQGTSPRRR